MWCPQTGDVAAPSLQGRAHSGLCGAVSLFWLLPLKPGVSPPRSPAMHWWQRGHQQHSQPQACTECAQSHLPGQARVVVRGQGVGVRLRDPMQLWSEASPPLLHHDQQQHLPFPIQPPPWGRASTVPILYL